MFISLMKDSTTGRDCPLIVSRNLQLFPLGPGDAVDFHCIFHCHLSPLTSNNNEVIGEDDGTGSVSRCYQTRLHIIALTLGGWWQGLGEEETNLNSPFHSIKYLQIVQCFFIGTETSNDVKLPLERGLN